MSANGGSYVALVAPLDREPYLLRIERSESLRRLQELVRSPEDGARSLIDAAPVLGPAGAPGAVAYVHDEGLFVHPLHSLSLLLAELGILASPLAGPLVFVGIGPGDGEEHDVPAWLADLLGLGDELAEWQGGEP